MEAGYELWVGHELPDRNLPELTKELKEDVGRIGKDIAHIPHILPAHHETDHVGIEGAWGV